MLQSTSKAVAVVIGVGSGLGAALARRFAAGYTVALIARNADYLAQLAAEIRGQGGNALPVPANVAEAARVESAFATIRDQIGDPEVLLYNAAMRPFGLLMETKPSTFENTWRVNLAPSYARSRWCHR
jgi:NAD(P)-dependent dehydrogenase (short-subunit alcohol dehydrogenase family)